LLKLSKIQCFLLGIGIIFLFYVLNRCQFVLGAEKAEGTFVFYVAENDTTGEKLVYPVIEYRVKDSVFQFKGREGSSYKLNEKIPLLLRKKEDPVVYTLESFWLYPLFYVLLPILLWAAFSLSYVNKNETVFINWRYPFFRKEKKDPGKQKLI
jgi:hypothetical protein